MNLTKKIAEYIYSFNDSEIDQKQLEKGKIHFIDTFASTICGTAEALAGSVRNYLRTAQIANGVQIIFQPDLKVTPTDAAFYYGICAHNCDFDDLSKTLSGHPGAVVMPIILALSANDSISGERALRAYIAGVETSSAIGRGFLETSFNKNLNPTTLLGIFGCVATAAILLELSQEEIVMALGLAASEASGLKVNYGSNTKDIAIGNVASKAIFAAQLAQIGITSNEDALGSDRGLFKILANDFNREKTCEAMDNKYSDFLDPGIILKPYPTCRGIQNGIDGALSLKAQYNIDYLKIDSITCTVQDTVINSNLYPVPANPPEAKFSLGYCIGLALIHHKLTVENFVEGGSLDNNALEIARKVEIAVGDRFTSGNAKSGIELKIKMKNGEQYTYVGYYAKGDPNNPMTYLEHKEKIMQCLGRTMNENSADKLLEKLETIETVTMDEIFELCGSKSVITP